MVLQAGVYTLGASFQPDPGHDWKMDSAVTPLAVSVLPGPPWGPTAVLAVTTQPVPAVGANLSVVVRLQDAFGNAVPYPADVTINITGEKVPVPGQLVKAQSTLACAAAFPQMHTCTCLAGT
jgi:hypothetical protein